MKSLIIKDNYCFFGSVISFSPQIYANNLIQKNPFLPPTTPFKLFNNLLQKFRLQTYRLVLPMCGKCRIFVVRFLHENEPRNIPYCHSSYRYECHDSAAGAARHGYRWTPAGRQRCHVYQCGGGGGNDVQPHLLEFRLPAHGHFGAHGTGLRQRRQSRNRGCAPTRHGTRISDFRWYHRASVASAMGHAAGYRPERHGAAVGTHLFLHWCVGCSTHAGDDGYQGVATGNAGFAQPNGDFHCRECAQHRAIGDSRVCARIGFHRHHCGYGTCRVDRACLLAVAAEAQISIACGGDGLAQGVRFQGVGTIFQGKFAHIHTQHAHDAPGIVFHGGWRTQRRYDAGCEHAHSANGYPFLLLHGRHRLCWRSHCRQVLRPWRCGGGA